MGKIFISHAVADVELVDAFVDFLQTACGVKTEDIFCTSIEGMNIPDGSSFETFIKEKMQDASFVIMIITPSYYESVFCLCELGATWVLQHNNFPLLVPPLTFADLKAVLSPLQAGKINDESDLANLFDRLTKAGFANTTTARFGLKKDAFIEKFKTLKIKGRTNVSAKEHDELKAKYDAAVEATLEYDKEIKKLNSQFKELASKKDPTDVNAILLAHSDEPEKFEALINEFKAAAAKLPRAAMEAMFHGERSETYHLPHHYGSEHIHEGSKDAAQRQFIKLDGNEVSLMDSHPLVFSALQKLTELRKFMGTASNALIEKYESDHEHPFSIRNRDFWEKNLGL